MQFWRVHRENRLGKVVDLDNYFDNTYCSGFACNSFQKQIKNLVV